MDEPTQLPAKQSEPDEKIALVELARSIAMGMHDLPHILADHEISEERYAEIVKNPFFARTLEAEIMDWHAARNTPERVKVEAAAIIERVLPTVAARMEDPQEALTAVTDAAKMVARLAGIGEKEAATGGGSSEKFIINIDMGGNKKLNYVKDITPMEPAIEVSTEMLPEPVKKETGDDG